MKNAVILLVAGAVFGGCVMQRELPQTPQAPRQATDVQVAPAASVAPAVVPSAPVPAARPAAPAAVQGHASAAVRPLRVLVSLDDENAAGKPSVCKRALQSNLEGALARAGFTVVYDKPAEILVSCALRGRQVNARGARVAWKGDADVQITRAPEVNAVNGRTMRDVVARKRFDVASGDARSADDAQTKLADRLAGAVSAFAAEGVNKVGAGLQRIEMTIVNAWQVQDAAGYPTLFTQKVTALKGVYLCRVLATDNAARTMRVEVIYDGAEYPDGFLNRLYVVPELNLVR